MKLKTILLAFSSCLLLPAIAQQKFISTRGKEVTDISGKPFIMRGINLGNWLVPEGYMFKFKEVSSPRLINETILELLGPTAANAFWKKYLANYITAADIHFLKKIGVNSIRVPFHYKLFTEEDYLGSRGEARGFALLDSVVRWCKREGIYVLLDMHCAPGGQTGDNIDDSYGYPFLYDSEESRALTVSIWKKIANHYKNETTVLGYDLLNEPIPHFTDTAHFNPLLEPLYKQIVNAVRSVDKNHIVFLGGAQWDSNFDVFGPPFDSKTVYTFHKYWTKPTQAVIQPYINFRDKYNVPIYCGETGENNNEWISTFRATLEENNIGWHYWPYKKMDNERCIIQYKRPAGYDAIIRYTDSVKKNFGDIRKFRPSDMIAVKKALEEFVDNCFFNNCIFNKEYMEALGFKTQ